MEDENDGWVNIHTDGPRRGLQQEEILVLLRENGPMKPSMIADALGYSRDSIRKTMQRMYNTGRVQSRGGWYKPLDVPMST